MCALLPYTRYTLCGRIHNSKVALEVKGPPVILILAMPYNGAYSEFQGIGSSTSLWQSICSNHCVKQLSFNGVPSPGTCG